MGEGSRKKHNLDMLNGSLLDKMLLFAIPIALSSTLQQLFNAVDVAVVGQFASSQDQAAVGCNSSLINLLLNLFVGVSVGANVVIANYIGQGQLKRIKDAVHTAILVAIISGFLLILIGMPISRPVLTLMGTPDDTLDLAVLYLRIYLVGMPFIMLYNFGSAILRSTGDTKRPMYALVIAGVVNTLLNLILVIFFHMGVAGVAIATVISNVISSGIVIYLLTHEDDPIHLSFRELGIARQDFLKMLRIGMPSGLQGMVFSVANVFIQASINSFGSDAVAGSSAALNFEYISYFVVNGFGQAAVTFVSQNYGAHKYDRCKKVFRLAMAGSVISSMIVSLTFMFGRTFFISFFTSKPNVAYYGEQRMLWVLTLYILLSSYEISGSALRGLGYSLAPALLTVVGTCVFRLGWIYTIFRKIHTYQMLLVVYPISWTITGILVVGAYILITSRIYRRMES